MTSRLMGLFLTLALPIFVHAQDRSDYDNDIYTKITFSEGGFEGWKGEAVLKANLTQGYDLVAFQVNYRFRGPGRGPGEESTVLTLAREDISSLKIAGGKLLIGFTIPKFYLLERMPYRYWGYPAEVSLNLDLSAKNYQAFLRIGRGSDESILAIRENIEDIPETSGLSNSYPMKIERLGVSCLALTTGPTSTASRP